MSNNMIDGERLLKNIDTRIVAVKREFCDESDKIDRNLLICGYRDIKREVILMLQTPQPSNKPHTGGEDDE